MFLCGCMIKYCDILLKKNGGKCEWEKNDVRKNMCLD